MIFPPRRATKHQTIYLQSSLPAFYQASCRCILRLAQSQNFTRLYLYATSGPGFKLRSA